MITLNIKKIFSRCLSCILGIVFMMTLLSCGATTFVRGRTSLAMTGGNTYDFGILDVGTTYSAILSLRNSGQANAKNIVASNLTLPFTYTGGTYPGTTGTCGTTLNVMQTCTLDITFTPPAGGTATDSITFSFDTATTVGLSYVFNITSFAKTPGTLDTTFDTVGYSTLLTGVDAYLQSLVIQPSGRIVAAGYDFDGALTYRSLLAGFHANGSLDTTFATSGFTQPAIFGSGNENFSSVSVQTDGTLVSSGSAFDGANFFMTAMRFDLNGAIDTTFNAGGNFTLNIVSPTTAYSNSLQTDNKIVLGGVSNNQWLLVRLNTDGSFDTTFNTTGQVQTAVTTQDTIRSTLIQADGSILVGGTSNGGLGEDATVGRYDSAGALDTTYNLTGYNILSATVNPDYILKSLLQADGKMVNIGYNSIGAYNECVVSRLNTDGSIDTTFNTTGSRNFDAGYETRCQGGALDSTGRIIVTGYTSNPTNRILIARIQSDGAMDTTFSATGFNEISINGVNDQATQVVIDSNGKYIISGSTSIAGILQALVARLWY
jgi:uncharacterized delta-60 repeat protein